MIERLVLVAALTLLAVLSALAVRGWARRRAQQLRLRDSRSLWSALGEEPDGRPALVVFSTPACVSCRTTQEPAVQQVRTQFGPRLRLIHVDIGDNPSVARAFRVLTAPSTALLSGDGRLQHLNQGFAPVDRLVAQLAAAGGAPAFARSPQPPARPAPGEPQPAARR